LICESVASTRGRPNRFPFSPSITQHSPYTFRYQAALQFGHSAKNLEDHLAG
jgi:hypothetical protein